MFELEMFKLMIEVNQIKFNDFSIFEFSSLIDKLNELIDNNLNINLIYEIIITI